MKGKKMRSCLSTLQKKSLRDFFKMEVSTCNGEMKMSAYGWQDLQEHCKKEMQKLEEVADFKINLSVRGYWFFYKELERICVLKLAFWRKHQGWLEFISPKSKERESAERMEALKRTTAICEQILEAKNGK